MKTLKGILIFAVVLALIGGTAYGLYSLTAGKGEQQSSNIGNVRLCNVTESVEIIGDDLALSIASSTPAQWIKIQQPLNATNTASFSFGGTAVSGQGQILYPSISASTTDFILYGHATDMPVQTEVTGITNTGSSTVNVTICR